MTKEEMLACIQQARELMDKVYYFAEAYNNDHRTNASPNMLEIERLMSWSDSCAMDAETHIHSQTNQISYPIRSCMRLTSSIGNVEKG